MENLTIEKLKDQKIIAEIEKEIDDLDNYGRAIGDISDKIATMNGLKKNLSKPNGLKSFDPSLYEKLNNILVRYKAHFMDLLSDEEVLKLFEEHFLDMVNYKLDYENQLKNFLFTKSYKERDPFLEKLREVMENSRQEINEFLLLGEKNARVKGYLKNWLMDYNQFLGKGQHLKIDISKYLFQSPNTKILKPEDKKNLKEFFEFYEKTKLKVNDPFGLGSYPLEMFGVEVVGEEGSLKAKFKPKEGGEIPEVEEVSAKPGEEIIPQEEEVISSEAWAKMEEKAAKKTPTLATEASPVKPEIEPEMKKTGTDQDIAGVAAEKSISRTRSAVLQPIPKKEITFSMESVESIQKLNPEIFRKISNDPKVAAEKIKSEAAKLVSQNPENIIIAKEMWQQSDLYKAYLEIAQEGMNTGLSVDKVIEARTKMGKDTLNKEEFAAVVDLSKVF